MPKRSRIPGKLETTDPILVAARKRHAADPILIAARIFEQVTGEPTKPPAKDQPPAREKNPNAVSMGRLGGPKGGKARAAKLTAKRRAEIAKKAARARWGG